MRYFLEKKEIYIPRLVVQILDKLTDVKNKKKDWRR
jgi:hypothetical protein